MLTWRRLPVRMDASFRWHDGGEDLTSPSIEAAWIPQRGLFRVDAMDRNDRLKRLRFRSRHRGIREADLLVGAYFDRWHESWSDSDMDWFEALLEEQDVDILAWAMGIASVPERWQGEMMRRLQSLDNIAHPR